MPFSARQAAPVLLVVGVVVFLIAAIAGNDPAYGAAYILIGIGLGIYASVAPPLNAASPQIVRIAFAAAAVAAVLDGLLTIGGQSSAVTVVLGFVVVIGVIVGMLGVGRNTQQR